MTISLFELMEKSIDRMGSGIHPQVRALALELVKRAYHKGIYVQITSGYRSNAEQTKLYRQGRYGNPGPIVTNAEAGESIHNYGLAIDYALLDKNGKIHWDIDRDLNVNQVWDWFEVAAIGKQLGFEWGGDWKSFKDYPHLDMQKGISTSRLAKGARPSIPSVPNRGYLGVGDSGPLVTQLQRNLHKIGIKVDVDGTFGEGTEAAVKEFQKKYKLTADGLYGSASIRKMNDALANLTPSTPKEPEVKPMPEEYLKDAQPSKSLKAEFDRAVANGLTDGTYATRPATREEVAVIVNRAYEKVVALVEASK